jgi:hypothetical protein
MERVANNSNMCVGWTKTKATLALPQAHTESEQSLVIPLVFSYIPW